MTDRIPAAGVHRTPKHLYYFNGELVGPGVTTIAGLLKFAPGSDGRESPLLEWRLKQVATTAIEQAERLVEDREAGRSEALVKYLTTQSTKAMSRGTRIHGTLESVLRREPYEVHPDDAPAVQGARAWLNQAGVRPIEVEAFLIHRALGYGGTVDLIAEIAGEVWLLDWKTSKSVAWPSGEVYSDHRLQLAAYANAELIARPGDPTAYPVPAIDRFGIVHVTDAGTRLYPADVTDADWAAFRACAYLHNWKKGARAA